MFRPRAIVSAAVLALAGGACSDSTGGDGVPTAQLALQPVFPATYTPGAFELAVDRVRVRLIRPPAEAVVDTVAVFPADATELTVRVKVPLLARRETMIAGLELSAGSRILFSGTREVEVADVPNIAPSIPLQYVGPGTEMTSLRIEPRDSALRPGAPFSYRILAFNGAVPLQDFYVGWSTSDPDHVAVDARGALVAPAVRGSFMLRVVSPTGIKDSTRVWISPPATTMTYMEGDEQTSAAGTQLPGLLIVRALAADGQGVPGVPVLFTALSGGTVREPLVLTDANGFARNTVILGPIAGLQLFEASSPGLPTVTFRSTAKAGPPFRVVALAGGNQQGIVGHLLGGALVAQVTDAAGNAIAGVPLTWQVVTGGGVLEQVDTETNLSGVALGIYRLGTLPGTNVVRVSTSGGILFTSFTATAAAGPPAGMEVVSGDGQTGVAGSTLAPFVVVVTDEFGNGLPGVTVHWNDGGVGGVLSAAATTTSVDGRASVTYTLPPVPGTVQIRAEVEGTPATVGFTATVAEPPTGSAMRSPPPAPLPARSGGSRRPD